MYNVLYACSEAYPLIKTGGLADVAGSLPVALKNLHQDIRLVLPAYREALAHAGQLQVVATLDTLGTLTPVRILAGVLPGTQVTLYLIEAPEYFDRPGGPYADPNGLDWPDNAARFSLFARAAVSIALNQAGLAWQPDIVHCNDWQTGLIPALLARQEQRPLTVFTIHNLAYQGLFSWEVFQSLDLPQDLWSPAAMEFYGQFSFIKGGLMFADWLTTVSPRYAQEIRTPELGYQLAKLLDHRAERLAGILNGGDYNLWDPRHDPFIVKNYDPRTLNLKLINKIDVQQHFKLPVHEGVALLGHIGRLVEQKGTDLLLDILPKLMQHPVQIIVLGSGEKRFEQRLLESVQRYPGRIAVHIGYDEKLAHRIVAGSDMFLMPSRFEPCGLTQIYSLRYGTVPIGRRTGGLADTIIDATTHTLKDDTATGFLFDEANSQELLTTLLRAFTLFCHPPAWHSLMISGMQQDLSWERSAHQYLTFYQQALNDQMSSTYPP